MGGACQQQNLLLVQILTGMPSMRSFHTTGIVNSVIFHYESITDFRHWLGQVKLLRTVIKRAKSEKWKGIAARKRSRCFVRKSSRLENSNKSRRCKVSKERQERFPAHLVVSLLT